MKMEQITIFFAYNKRFSYWSKVALRLLATISVFLLPAASEAGTFTNWPTYASEPVTNWPKASEYDELVEDLTWTHNALIERCIVAGVSTNSIGPASGGTRWPKDDIQRFKDKVEELVELSRFVDTSQTDADGTFDVYFSTPDAASNYPSDFPMLTVTGVLAEANLASNYFDYTPLRCLNGIGPFAYPTDYGWQGSKAVIPLLAYTCHGVIVSTNHTSNSGRRWWDNSGGYNYDPGWDSVDWIGNYYLPGRWPSAMLNWASEPNFSPFLNKTFSWTNKSEWNFETDITNICRPGWRYRIETAHHGIVTNFAGPPINPPYWPVNKQVRCYLFGNYAAGWQVIISSHTYGEWTTGYGADEANDLLGYSLSGVLFSSDARYLDGSDTNYHRSASSGWIQYDSVDYMGALIVATRWNSILQTDTNNFNGIYDGICTNYSSVRDLYLWGSWPNCTPYSRLTSNETYHGNFAWDPAGDGYPNLVENEYRYIWSSGSTNSRHTLYWGMNEKTNAPYSGVQSCQRGWGVSNGLWLIKWDGPNGFQYK